MKRAAILIGNPGIEGSESFLPGVRQDLIEYQEYLSSFTGGEWKNDEIFVLECPTKSQLRDLRNNLNSDFSIVSFSGHGVTDTTTGRTLMLANNLEDDRLLTADDLATFSKRQIIIMDCCRNHVEVAVGPIPLGTSDRDSAFYGPSTRRAYEDGIMNCKEGTVLLYACNPGQKATETQKGGLFTEYLINAAYSWAPDRHSGQSYSISRAFDVAKSKIIRSPYAQRPIMIAEAGNDFPLGIKPPIYLPNSSLVDSGGK